MGGGGDPEIKDTEAQKALAQMAKEQWQIYQKMFIPVEDQWMDKVDQLNDPRYHNNISQAGQLSSQTAFNPAINQAIGQQAQMGMGPNSGRFQGSINKGYNAMAKAISDTVNSGQIAQQDRYLNSIGNVAAIGLGQSTTATNNMGNITGNQNQYAISSAETALGNQMGKGGLAGIGAGIVGKQYLPDQQQQGG